LTGGTLAVGAVLVLASCAPITERCARNNILSVTSYQRCVEDEYRSADNLRRKAERSTGDITRPRDDD
jgi:hypothetical protein